MLETTLLGSELPVLQSQLLNEVAGVVHFSTLRGTDDYNMCDYTGDDPAHLAKCREQFAAALSIPVDRLWFPRQVHGTDIAVVDATTPQGEEADAVITCEKGLCIGVSTADCVPVLLAMKDRQGEVCAIAAIHAGWRGTVKHIVRMTVERLCEVSGGKAEDIVAVVGPSISVEAYEVGEEVAQAFVEANRGDCVCRNYPKPHIDLWQSNVMDLLEAGVDLFHIDCSPACTWQNPDRLFSARRLGKYFGRIASCLLMR